MPTAGTVDPPPSVRQGAEPEPADTILLRHRWLNTGIRLQWHRAFGAGWMSEPPFGDSGRDPTSELVVELDSLYILYIRRQHSSQREGREDDGV